jgi:hypothetical protein
MRLCVRKRKGIDCNQTEISCKKKIIEIFLKCIIIRLREWEEMAIVDFGKFVNLVNRAGVVIRVFMPDTIYADGYLQNKISE